MGKPKKPKAIKRPFATHYFTDIGARDDAYVHQGAAKTEDGAKRATVVRIILEQYVKAHIYDRRTGVLIYTLKRTSAGISVHYGRATQEYAEQMRLRRVK